MEEYQEHSRKLALRFLQTAVVVDDKAYMASEHDNGPRGEVVKPSRIRASDQNDQDPAHCKPHHSLDADSVIDSFSQLGVICGVIRPTDSALEAMKKADIVVLDWFLRDNDPEYTLKLFGDLLAGESDQNSLRLVSIYTGEPDLEKVCNDVVKKLTEASLNPIQDNAGTTILYQHGHVVLYAKSDVNLAKTFKDRSVVERKLPEKLVEDFAAMTRGLLPRIALTSLTAIRESEHKVLAQFSARLDPAFLAHKACLPNPGDAERQIVNHIAEELRGLMDNAVAETSSKDIDAVEYWIKNKGEKFMFGDKELSAEETIALVNKGLHKSSKLKDRHFKNLSAGFSGSNTIDFDKQLAWIMSFRTVYKAPLPTLWLGSVVTELSSEGDQHLICMRPRCDCVRLDEEKEITFFFLPLLLLVEPGNIVKPRKGNEQIVVRLDDKFERLRIELDSSSWVHRQFRPSTGSDAVVAAKSESDGDFKFTDICKTEYKWRGELKAEYAQRIAQKFSESLSRVAIDESEWLRRMAK